MAVAALCTVVAGASAITVATGTFSVNVGETVDVPISLDSVPNGLIGADFTTTLGNGATADIIGYAKPGWASFAHTAPDPITAVDSATISIIDMTGVSVPLGATNISLGTLKVRGMAAGTTSIEIAPSARLGIQDRSGFMYEVTALPGTLAVFPALKTITPTTGRRGATVSTTITGSGFAEPATVTLSQDNPAAPLSPHLIPATSVVVVSPSQITCTFALDADGPTGIFDLTVSMPGGSTATKTGAFTVYDPLSVSAIAPDTGVQGTTVHATITGTGFVSPATVTLSQPDPSAPLVPHLVLATSVVVVSPTQITCDVVLETTGATGTFDLVVTDSFGTSATRTGAFTITVPLTPTPTPGVIVFQIPGGVGIPTDTDADTLFDDVNGNGHSDFADVVLFFNQMIWIAANEPVSAFDYNGNGRIDFADVIWLFNNL